MEKLELSNNQLERIINKFDTELIEWDGDLRQEFEIEEAYTNEHTRKDIDLKVVVDLIQTNNTIEVESIKFEIMGFYLASPDNLDLIYDENYLDKLEDRIKTNLNN